MPVCEVLLERDARAPRALAPLSAPRRYLVRRLLSAACLLTIDVTAVLIALQVATLLVGPRVGHPFDVRLVAALLVLLTIVAAHGMYGLRSRRRSVTRILSVAALTLLAPLLVDRITDVWTTADIVVAWAIGLSLSLMLRLLYDLTVRRVIGYCPRAKRVLFLGTPATYDVFADAWLQEHSPAEGRLAHVLGVVAADAGETVTASRYGARVLGSLADLDAIVVRDRAEELVVVDPELARTGLDDIVRIARERRLVLKLSNADGRFAPGVTVLSNGGDSLLVATPRTHRPVGWFVKRLLDVATALLLLVLTAPLFAAVAVVIKLTSPGPVFFKDERLGIGNQMFLCYKFRTMRADAPQLQAQLEAQNEADGCLFKMRDDPRVTRVGRTLRKYSIDELPQLINVVRGEMSLVGPRPLPLRDNRLLEPEAKRRHAVLPGITGPWQVSGRSDSSFEQMLQLDAHYIDAWSLWLDLTIILKTFKAVLASEGAY